MESERAVLSVYHERSARFWIAPVLWRFQTGDASDEIRGFASHPLVHKNRLRIFSHGVSG
jgi:hypothetical protein